MHGLITPKEFQEKTEQDALLHLKQLVFPGASAFFTPTREISEAYRLLDLQEGASLVDINNRWLELNELDFESVLFQEREQLSNRFAELTESRTRYTLKQYGQLSLELHPDYAFPLALEKYRFAYTILVDVKTSEASGAASQYSSQEITQAYQTLGLLSKIQRNEEVTREEINAQLDIAKKVFEANADRDRNQQAKQDGNDQKKLQAYELLKKFSDPELRKVNAETEDRIFRNILKLIKAGKLKYMDLDKKEFDNLILWKEIFNKDVITDFLCKCGESNLFEIAKNINGYRKSHNISLIQDLWLEQIKGYSIVLRSNYESKYDDQNIRDNTLNLYMSNNLLYCAVRDLKTREVKHIALTKELLNSDVIDAYRVYLAKATNSNDRSVDRLLWQCVKSRYNELLQGEDEDSILRKIVWKGVMFNFPERYTQKQQELLSGNIGERLLALLPIGEITDPLIENVNQIIREELNRLPKNHTDDQENVFVKNISEIFFARPNELQNGIKEYDLKDRVFLAIFKAVSDFSTMYTSAQKEKIDDAMSMANHDYKQRMSDMIRKAQSVEYETALLAAISKHSKNLPTAKCSSQEFMSIASQNNDLLLHLTEFADPQIFSISGVSFSDVAQQTSTWIYDLVRAYQHVQSGLPLPDAKNARSLSFEWMCEKVAAQKPEEGQTIEQARFNYMHSQLQYMSKVGLQDESRDLKLTDDNLIRPIEAKIAELSEKKDDDHAFKVLQLQQCVDDVKAIVVDDIQKKFITHFSGDSQKAVAKTDKSSKNTAPNAYDKAYTLVSMYKDAKDIKKHANTVRDILTGILLWAVAPVSLPVAAVSSFLGSSFVWDKMTGNTSTARLLKDANSNYKRALKAGGKACMFKPAALIAGDENGNTQIAQIKIPGQA